MSGRPFYLNIRHKISQLLNPALCQVCGISIHSSDYICPDCVNSMHHVHNPCELCGLPNPVADHICPSCLHHPPPWQSMTAPIAYQGEARKLIKSFKFDEQIHIAQILAKYFHHCFNSENVEVLLPVPLHVSRLLDRGFNQAEEIAKALSLYMPVPIDRISLTRVKETESQSGLSLNQRRSNIIKAFHFDNARQYKSVAIVDDIITSGSTMTEICKNLRKSGVRNIEVWSLARALKHD